MKKRLILFISLTFFWWPGMFMAQYAFTESVHQWLQREMELIKKLPGTIKRCFEAKMHCGPEDEQIIKSSAKRITAVLAILSGLAIGTILLKRHMNGKIDFYAFNLEEQEQVIGQFQDAIESENVDEVRKLFSWYAIPSDLVNQWFATVVRAAPPAMVQVMLDNGADPSYVFKPATEGATMTMLGATLLRTCGNQREIENTTQIITMLLNRGAHINSTKDEGGYTPLMIAVDCNLPVLAQLLITKGADKTIKNNKGQTAYDIAIQKGWSENNLNIVKP
jgi:hypothetical protein